ncbi:hypothetical protein C0Q70_03789 [Pomacea canaliculata]|uniref:RING-type domain-containing protein n=1 Tax=Pomacea canaliculata TaxID=400727 RepID=A0A2T7PTR1_POMCA|nr:hypothetical protein C0Q70_03789 [Pomacea canaliculata]
METVVQTHERECAVCTNDLNTPKILPCGHLLCRQCVISWMDSESDPVCPLCTCPIVEHENISSESSANVVDALPTDFVMEAIVESSHVLVKDGMCTICDDVTAEYICMECVERMCPSCMKIHKKMVATRSHDVESVSTVTPERLAASRPALCADHGDKHADFFCTDHSFSICASCSSKKHWRCSLVKDLDEEIKFAETTLSSLTEILNEEEESLKQALDEVNVRLLKADVTEQENMAHVDRLHDRIQKLVEDSRITLKKLILDSSSKVQNPLLHIKIELHKRFEKVTSHKDIVTRARAVAPRPVLIHVTQTLTDRVNNLDVNADIQAEVWKIPSLAPVRLSDDVVKRIETELHLLEQQLAEDEVTALPTSKRLSEPLMSQFFKYFQHKVSFLDAVEDEFHTDILQTEETE